MVHDNNRSPRPEVQCLELVGREVSLEVARDGFEERAVAGGEEGG